ncbi:MAG: sialidase family protein, partial [Planctomycetota bacterium]
MAWVWAAWAAAGPAPKGSDVPGVVIDYQDARTRQYVGSPSLAVLPDGRYVASHDLFGPGSRYSRTRVFRSADQGRTWRHLADLDGQFWSGLFVHRRALYVMGTSQRYGVVVIRRSADGGATWTEPRDATTGLLTDEPIYHTAPVPVVVHRGRLWRAMEVRTRKGPKQFGALVMSAPADADLLRAENWTASNTVFFDPAWRKGVRHWREGNVVVTPKGTVVNIIRTDPRPGIAAVLDVSQDGRTLTFDPQTGFIDFIGGAVKFTIRFDPQTRRYWTLASKQTDPPATRNVLVLTSSADLRAWRLESHILVHPDRRHHAFQYIDWLFEGADLIAVSRTAWDGSHNFHDANYLTFHRIPDFRDRTRDAPPLNAPAPRPERKAPGQHLVAAWDFERGRG